MANEDFWKDLTDNEKTSCDELNGHRAISDWPGYPPEMTTRAKGAKAWLEDRLADIKKEISSSSNDENHAQHRYNRRDYIKAVINADERTIHNHGPSYPSGHATENEDVYIEEREYYLGWSTQYEAQKERKLANLDWLEERRKYVWNCAEGNVDDVEPGWKVNHRQERYDNLQIATHYGSAWEEWQKEEASGGSSGGGNWRDKSGSWHDKHLGITESPADSNCDSRSDGIRTSQDGCANGTWLRYQPWCGCWAWSGLYAAGKVKKGDSWMASVASIEDYAKASSSCSAAGSTSAPCARSTQAPPTPGRATPAPAPAGRSPTAAGPTSAAAAARQKRTATRWSETEEELMNRNDERVDGQQLKALDEPGSDSLLDDWVRHRAQRTEPVVMRPQTHED
jgi:hypothetical protein